VGWFSILLRQGEKINKKALKAEIGIQCRWERILAQRLYGDKSAAVGDWARIR